jgi:hypothetical protein
MGTQQSQGQSLTPIYPSARSDRSASSAATTRALQDWLEGTSKQRSASCSGQRGEIVELSGSVGTQVERVLDGC